MSAEEVIGGPFEVWLAAPNSAAPDVDTAPSGAWTLLGVSGDKNITEDGIMLELPQTIEYFRALGTTGRRKGFRTEEDPAVEFTLADMTAEAIAKALGNSVTDTAAGSGTPGHRDVPLLRGFNVEEYAVLIRGDGQSPYNSAWNSQWWIPRAVMDGSPQISINKAVPQGILFRFEVLEDDTNGFGKAIIMDAVAL